jgi:pyruvate/2-oxoglutarate/acetoin dehydrogenase E1 component
VLYTRPLLVPGQGDLVEFDLTQGEGAYPNFALHFKNQTPRLTLATYGFNFELARAAALHLVYEHEVFADIILFSQLSPFDISPLLPSLSQTRHLLTVEEGGLSLGWGAEIAARVAEVGMGDIKVRRVAALDLPIGNSKALEDATLPSQEMISQAALELVGE